MWKKDMIAITGWWGSLSDSVGTQRHSSRVRHKAIHKAAAGTHAPYPFLPFSTRFPSWRNTPISASMRDFNFHMCRHVENRSHPNPKNRFHRWDDHGAPSGQ